MIPGTKGSGDPSSLFPQNDLIASSVFAGNYPIDASSSLLEDDLNLHFVLFGSIFGKFSFFLSQNGLIATCVFFGNLCVDASSSPLDNSVLCCASYAGSQSVDASFPPFLDDLILSQVFTCNQSVHTRSCGFQNDSIDPWRHADKQSNRISLLFLAMAPNPWTKTLLATSLITLASPLFAMAPGSGRNPCWTSICQ